MSAPEIHWRQTTYDWDGASFSFELSHGLESAAARWLDFNLEDRLARVPGMAGVEVRVTEAVWSEGSLIGEGHIILRGITNPWPDAETLRDHIDATVREATQTADVALSEVKHFANQWREATQDLR